MVIRASGKFGIGAGGTVICGCTGCRLTLTGEFGLVGVFGIGTTDGACTGVLGEKVITGDSLVALRCTQLRRYMRSSELTS